FWKAAIRAAFRDKGLSIPELRARSERNGRVHPPFPTDTGIEEIVLEGLRCAAIRPPRERPGKVVLYLHGGGYVTGSIESYWMLCVPLARALGLRVVLPEYRLAPEHPYPAALEDALKAFRGLLAEGHAASDIVLAGDSAGGGLCLAAALSLRDSGSPSPAALICLSPWADLTNSGASHASNAKSEALLDTRDLDRWAALYAGGARREDPYVSPVNGDFRGFPPLLIQVDRGEILLDDSRAVAEKARAAGVDLVLSVWEGLWHVWPALGDLVPESGAAFAEARAFLEARSIL
ncbi:MAG: alpha/beta hydrolase, partial [Treponema sp.]|nr:alpha/beta hydrolase [Treponema sp.]